MSSSSSAADLSQQFQAALTRLLGKLGVQKPIATQRHTGVHARGDHCPDAALSAAPAVGRRGGQQVGAKGKDFICALVQSFLRRADYKTQSK
jgi:hypothetical protein